MYNDLSLQKHLPVPLTPRQLTFSNENMKLGRAVIELKRKYEAIARSWQTLTKSDRKQFELQNLAPQIHPTTGNFIYAFRPDNFIFAVLGANYWSHASYGATEGKHLTIVNPWLIAGGLRKKSWFDMDQSVFQQLVPQFEAATISDNTGLGSFSSWLKPFPLLWAEEGKNRIQSYQDTNTDLLTSVTICEFMPAASLRLYRSVLDNSVWLLRYVGGIDAHWDHQIQQMGALRRQRFGKVVLPFPEVGVPLLQNYGVKIDKGWGAPWRLVKHAEIQECKHVRSQGWS